MYSWRGGWSWCTVREGGEELVYSWREGGAGVQLEREGWSWCTAGEGGVELVYSKYS